MKETITDRDGHEIDVTELVPRPLKPLTPDEITQLGQYNRDVSMGRTHRPEYVEIMDQQQRRFEAVARERNHQARRSQALIIAPAPDIGLVIIVAALMGALLGFFLGIIVGAVWL